MERDRRKDHNVGRTGPDLSLKAQCAIGAIIAALIIWILPALTQWIAHRIPPPAPRLNAESREAELARHYAAVIAACMNGRTITDGQRVVECRPR
jgi:hypothetical protein